MTQPKFAPITAVDEVRATRQPIPARPWRLGRPADLRPGVPLPARLVGAPGPDQGYALKVARRFEDALVLAEHEHRDDVIAGAVALAMRRAAMFGRAPIAADVQVALLLFGFFGPASDALVSERRARFFGVSHDEWARRALVDAVPEELLRLTPERLGKRPEIVLEHLSS